MPTLQHHLQMARALDKERKRQRKAELAADSTLKLEKRPDKGDLSG